MQLFRSVLRRQDMSPRVFLVAATWRCVLLAAASPAVLLWAEDWDRKLAHLRSDTWSAVIGPLGMDTGL